MNIRELVTSAVEYGRKGNLHRAIKLLNKAFRIEPNNPLVLYNLAFAYHKENNLIMAKKIYELALKNDPNNFLVYLNLGQIYQTLLDFKKSKEAYLKALKYNPNSFEIYTNLGLTYFGLGDIKNAITSYKKAINLNPKANKAYSNMGSLYSFLNERDQAIYYFKKAIEIDQNNFKNYNILGLIYYQKEDIPNAIENFEKALSLSPNNEGTLYNLGNAYKEWNSKKAIYYYEKALKIAPSYFDVLVRIYFESREICDWSSLEIYANYIKNLSKIGIIGQRFPGETPFDNVRRTDDPAENLRVATVWSTLIQKQVESLNPHFKFEHLKKNPNKKIRIGYLSNDYRDHPIGYLVRHIFKNHDREPFEVFAYSSGIDDKSLPRKEVEKYSDHFVDINNLSVIDAAKKIYEDKIDILIDLTGYTKGGKLEVLALKPAPIQINYLGFVGSMGADFIDYIITDKVLTPPSLAKYYSEKFIYMPTMYQINGPYEVSKRKLKKTDFGLPENKIIFAAFNKPEKIDPYIFKTWMNILKRVPNSIIWLYPKNQLITKINLEKEAKKYGINPERIIYAERIPLDQHLARLKFVDIALDTHTYSGGATTSQLLYMGVPTITYPGKNYIRRMSAALLSGAGIPELIVKSYKEYEDLAVELATDGEKLKQLKFKLSKKIKNGPMFMSTLFVKNLEKVYKIIYKNYQKNIEQKIIDITSL